MPDLLMAARLRRVVCWSALAGVLLLPLTARADKPQWAYRNVPFAQALNLDAVYEVTHSAPEELITTIRGWGIDLQLVHSEAPVQPMNPLLAGLPLAEPELIRRAGFCDTCEGMVILCNLNRSTVDRDTILVRDTALSYTLIHEFVQSLLRPLYADEPDDALEARFGVSFRRLVKARRPSSRKCSAVTSMSATPTSIRCAVHRGCNTARP